MKTLTLPGLVIALLILSGCADGNYRPYTLDDSFGQSVRHMAKAQTADPQAAENPQPDSPRKMDGYAGVSTMGGYRSGFAAATTESQGVSINIGGTGGSSGSQ